MVGKFKCKLTGTEIKQGQNGKVYMYACLLQGSEIVKAELENDKLYNDLNQVKELAELEVDLDIVQGFWNGSRYVRNILLGFVEKYNDKK